ncbi:class I SAM-dependent methyltransferase [Nocardia pneumoniae]|uniref:class I SAM-dependent methyltransferase n=1 Tax=Nocardia pneumoniae TaxID=228601 RepID=UPI0002E26C1B|nr:class I SAM-dependent methyltransferase [Nocardia pneumoniae]
MTPAFRWWGDITNRLRIGPTFSWTPDRSLIELVEGSAGVVPGPALDIGCGNGRNALYLARHGWHVTGVDLLPSMLTTARAEAESQGLTVRFLEGDVTKLSDLAIDTEFTLLVDGGCLHMVPQRRRAAYAAGINSVAADGARLIVFGFIRHPLLGGGVSADELRRLFPDWDLLDAAPIPGPEVSEYISRPAIVRKALARQWLTAWRYQLQYRP